MVSVIFSDVVIVILGIVICIFRVLLLLLLFLGCGYGLNFVMFCVELSILLFICKFVSLIFE